MTRDEKASVSLRPEILLCPNIPAPMHGLAPRVILGSKWWNKTRKEAYERAKLQCQACGVSKHQARFRQWLEGHELYETNYRAGRLTYLETVALCHCCHNYIHDGRMRYLLGTRGITHAKFTAIIEHGDSVLAKAGLERPSYEERHRRILAMMTRGEMCPWEDWRLVLFGKEYPPIHKTSADQQAYFIDKETGRGSLLRQSPETD